MEPRVPNLISSENQDPTRNGNYEAGILPFNPTSNATQLPAIRTLPVTETSYSNGSPFQDKTNQAWRQTSSADTFSTADTSKREAVAARSGLQPHVTRRPAKSAVPLEQVLNNSSPQPRKDYNLLSFDVEPRKKRRVDSSDPRHLPKPAPSQKQSNKRRHARPLLPPLLAPLQDPPPDARLVPSIDTNDYRNRQADIPQPEPKSAPAAVPASATPSKAAAEETEQNTPLETGQESKNTQEKCSNSEPRKRKKNKRWTEEETKDLFKGIAKFGIGSWKKILNYEEYHFNGRSAVDLKDRFRTVCPEEYNSSKSKEKVGDEISGNNEKTNEIDQPDYEEPAKVSTTGSTSNRLAQLGIQGPFPKRQRRGRREFTEQEDKALLKGFDKYGAKWKLIRDDPGLNLGTRSRTDLRDRFRNRYPKRFIEAGYKFRLKESDDAKDGNGDGSTDNTKESREVLASSAATAGGNTEDSDANLLFGVAPPTSAFDPPLSATSRERTSHPLRVLTEPMPLHFAELDISDYEPSPLEDEDPTSITLSRNIFDWADAQPSRPPLKSSNDSQSQALSSQPRTLSTLDQFRINPFVAMKGPTTSSLAHLMNSEDSIVGSGSSMAATGMAKEYGFRAPNLPLAGILNGPASLPSASELMREVDAEGK